MRTHIRAYPGPQQRRWPAAACLSYPLSHQLRIHLPPVHHRGLTLAAGSIGDRFEGMGSISCEDSLPISSGKVGPNEHQKPSVQPTKPSPLPGFSLTPLQQAYESSGCTIHNLIVTKRCVHANRESLLKQSWAAGSDRSDQLANQQEEGCELSLSAFQLNLASAVPWATLLTQLLARGIVCDWVGPGTSPKGVC